MKYKYPIAGVAVVVIRDGKILLMKRQGAHAAGTWACPGGKMDFGEEPIEAAKREAMEEVGINLVDIMQAGYINNIFADEGKHFITLYFVATTKDEPVIKEPNKCSEIGWFTLYEVPEPLFPGLVRFLRTFSL